MKLAIAFLALTLNAQTYTKDIAPILDRACAPCHRPGEAAPFSLLDYANAKAHAKQIAEATRKRIMPPWQPAPGKGDFEGDRRLTASEIQLIGTWASNGAPEGDPRHRPAPPKFIEGWQLGQPDMVVALDRPYTLSASGPDVFRNFILRVPVDRRRFVRAIEIRPGVKKVVHHANLLIDRDRTSRRRDGKDGSPGFPGMDVRIETRSFDPDSHFLFWKPGTSVLEEPEGMAWHIDPNTDLVLNMHLQPSGKPESIQPSVGLYFTNTPPSKRPMLIQLENDGALNIPPGKPDHVVTDQLILPIDLEVLGVYPHAHYIAQDMKAIATLPDGSTLWLIHIPDWDINWQAVYRYKTPVFLPKGTVVSMRYTYNNSAANPRNPSQPPIQVVNGDRSIDEMAHLWLQVLPRGNTSSDPRLTVQKALMQRRLEKYPSDFLAEFSLGSILQTENDLQGAIAHYRKALKVNPSDASAHNALGSALLSLGNTTEALAKFQTAIHFEPNYADAHYNLARVLLAQDQISSAISHLREVIRIEPDDAPATGDLGAALYMTGDKEDGLRYLRSATRQQPDYFNARYNLGQALAAEGKADEAEAEFREALRLKPGDEDATNALKRLGRR